MNLSFTDIAIIFSSFLLLGTMTFLLIKCGTTLSFIFSNKCCSNCSNGFYEETATGHKVLLCILSTTNCSPDAWCKRYVKNEMKINDN